MKIREIEEGKNIVLSLETAVLGGSISLLSGASELDCWIGSEKVSKSVDILEEIGKILDRNAIEKKSIKKIIVSSGPGSHTGIRVGMALGFGLKRSLDCEMMSVSSLYAMFLDAVTGANKSVCEIITAVPAGRNQICWQSFGNDSQTTNKQPALAQTSTVEDFAALFYKTGAEKGTDFTRKTLILHSKLYLHLRTEFGCHPKFADFSDAGENIARINGIAALKSSGDNIIFRL